MAAEAAGKAEPAASAEAAEPPVACKECAEGYVWKGEAKGQETALGTLKAYYSAPDNADATAAVLFIHDAFGWSFLNNRLLCDRLAAEAGCHVYMPDFYDGEVIVTEQLAQDFDDPKPSFLARVQSIVRVAISLPGVIWKFSKLDAEKTQAKLDEAVKGVREAHGGEGCKLGAVGYCWGGKYALCLGAQGKVAACVACHPSFVKPKEDKLSEMKAPCFFVLAEQEPIFTEKVWKETQEALKQAGVTVEFKKYPGTKHGFAVRCNEEQEQQRHARNDAFKQTAAWFVKYLS